MLGPADEICLLSLKAVAVGSPEKQTELQRLS